MRLTRVNIEGHLPTEYVNLEQQLGLIEHPSSGDHYLLHLQGPDEKARVGLLIVPGFFKRATLQEEWPLHGISGFRPEKGVSDSYYGLKKILSEGFNGRRVSDPNATILADGNEIFFRSFTTDNAIEQEYAASSKRDETKGDRYFLQFKQFTPGEASDYSQGKDVTVRWIDNEPQLLKKGKSKFPYPIWYDLRVYRAEPADMRVTILLSREHREAWAQRIQHYDALCRQFNAEVRYL